MNVSSSVSVAVHCHLTSKGRAWRSESDEEYLLILGY